MGVALSSVAEDAKTEEAETALAHSSARHASLRRFKSAMSRRDACVQAGSRRIAGGLLFLGATLGAGHAAAIGLGPARLSSGLGEPLRLSVPVTLQPDEEVGCVQVRPHGDDLPAVFNTRTQVIRSGGQTTIEIRSPQAVDEPAIGLVISVGCASPVARDYVLFLDPPVVSATSIESSPSADQPVRVAPLSPRRAATRAAPSVPATAASISHGDASGAPARAPRKRPTKSSPAIVPRADASSTPTPASPAVAGPPRGDRLSIMPTEPPVVGRTARSPQPGVFPPPVTGGAPASITTPSVPAVTPSVPVTAPAATAPPPAAAPVAAAPAGSVGALPATGDAEALAHEEALRQQQVALQAQIKTLSDQIAALRVQTTSLVARNQALEETAFTPTLVWLLMALAVLAIIVAGWMAWRYTQLRRSIEGSAWWTANSALESGTATPSVEAASELSALDGATRMAGRTATPTDTHAPATVVPPTTVVPAERARPTVRSGNYRAAIDTDFTVSDIEAAMATVRTVSPPRASKSNAALEDADFAPLGGPTIPSPFAEPPAPPVPPQTPIEPEGIFVDLDFQRVQPTVAVSARDVVPPKNSASAEIKPLEFKLDEPDVFDPLGTDSLKTTVFDRNSPKHQSEFDAPGASNGLDFELPSATQISSMTNLLDEAEAKTPRHASAALDDLFNPVEDHGIDTILDLDEREGSSLSTSEVDRLITPDERDVADDTTGSTRERMARFAALLDRVDEAAMTDPLRAITLLRQFVLRDEGIPTLFWLRLFDLYRQVDKRPVYEALAEHFSRRYHRTMAGWDQSFADRAPQTPLSAMPMIDRAIEAQWGSDAGIELVQKLLCDRTQEDAIVFNAVLQRDLLDATKIFPKADQHTGPGEGANSVG